MAKLEAKLQTLFPDLMDVSGTGDQSLPVITCFHVQDTLEPMSNTAAQPESRAEGIAPRESRRAWELSTPRPVEQQTAGPVHAFARIGRFEGVRGGKIIACPDSAHNFIPAESDLLIMFLHVTNTAHSRSLTRL